MRTHEAKLTRMLRRMLLRKASVLLGIPSCMDSPEKQPMLFVSFANLTTEHPDGTFHYHRSTEIKRGIQYDRCYYPGELEVSLVLLSMDYQTGSDLREEIIAVTLQFITNLTRLLISKTPDRLSRLELVDIQGHLSHTNCCSTCPQTQVYYRSEWVFRLPGIVCWQQKTPLRKPIRKMKGSSKRK